jgi:hypothetical protein
MTHGVSTLGFWKLAFYAEIPAGVAEGMGQIEELQGQDASDPATYELLALSLEAEAPAMGWPKRLAPYRILNEIQRHQYSGLDPDLVREIRESAEECGPVFYGALRQWADHGPEVVSNEVAGLLFALMGEIGGPELIPELLVVYGCPDSAVVSHAFWAVWRLGQRFPEAAFQSLRGLGAEASSGFRATLAEQIYLLPEIAGKRQAILGLLDGFPEVAKENDAAYLLLTVSTLVAMLGAAGESLAILQRHDRQLTKEGRRWIQEALDLEEAFVPDILTAGLDELDIEGVCVDLELMGEDEEFDDEFEEEYEDEFENEFDEPVEAAPKPGRNDPCWCGSGKKYKKCHLAADEEAERSGAGRDGLPELDETIGATWQDLLERASDWHRQDEALTAMELFFGDVPRELGAAGLSDSGFFEWYLLDYRPKSTGRTMVEEYLRRRGPRLDDAQRELLESWRDLRYGLWEVQRIEKGRGAEIQDVFSGDSLFVADVNLSNSGSQWDCLIGRMHRWKGQWIFAGNGLLVPRGHLNALRERVEAGSRDTGMSAAEYFRSRSHQWRREIVGMADRFKENLKIVNFEGDPIEFSAAEYEVTDPAQAASALLHTGEFEETQESGTASRAFAWLETGKKKDNRRSYGRIEIRDGVLRLECNSRARLAKGKRLVKKHAGKWLRHLRDTFESLDDARRRAKESPEPEPASSIDPAVEREIILKYKAKHYETWPDEALPALGGRTPREAVRSREGKAAVEALLRDFENTEDRERQRGKPAFDFSGLRKTLGL